jgi:APA family basic amino acid/polyamine antiporter
MPERACTEVMDQTASPETGLRRRLGVVGLTLYGIGVTVGAGIYVLVGKVAGLAGVMSPLAFLVASVVAGMSAMSFAELSVRYPRSAGEAMYVREGFGSLAFSLFMGLAVAVAGLVSASAVVVGSSGYIATLIALPTWTIVVLLILMLTLLAIWGIAESVAIIGLVTIVEIGGLVLILLVAVPEALTGPAVVPVSMEWSGAGFAGAVVIAFFAFIGFEDMVNVVEEVRRPEKTMPRAIIATLLISTLLYISLAWASIAVTGVEDLAKSEAPLGLVFERATGWSSAPFSVVAAFATINGALVLIIMGSRVLYGLASQRALPLWLAHIWPVTATPVPATLVAAGFVLVCAVSMPIGILAQIGSVLTLSTFTVVNIALIAIKRRPDAVRPIFAVPGWWPWVATLASGAVLTGEAMRLLG